jgi:hypothetical protein
VFLQTSNITKSKELLAFLSALLILGIALAASRALVNARVQVVDNPPPSPTSISCSVSPSSFTLGNSVSINGSISPSVSNAAVTLTYTKPDGTTLSRSVTTGADGTFGDDYTPDTAGSWSVKASWAGNDSYLGSTSFDTTFTVGGSTGGGIPIVYVSIAVVIVLVVIAAIAVYLYRRSRT